jgi:sterol desaturase/sphingolipid hydroxylase (fatty acid hydroxylase superfamily)
LLNLGQVGVVLLAGIAWDGWMGNHRPWSADALGPIGGAILGYVVLTFVYYWWHRWRHESDFLWRWVHQVHHSPQRIEVITAFYKHPIELLANSLLSSAILYLLVGLSPAAAAGATLLSGLAELFYHWNVPTPYWVGFFIQRPESHCVHHQEGLHAYNYGDLPIWDMLFGTFRNPRSFDERCGFAASRELRLLTMLRGVDIHKADPVEKL